MNNEEEEEENKCTDLATFLGNPTAGYTILNLSAWFGTKMIGPKGGVAIGQSLQTNYTLQILNLDNNKVGPESGVGIGQSLQTNNTLQKLYLESNNLDYWLIWCIWIIFVAVDHEKQRLNMQI